MPHRINRSFVGIVGLFAATSVHAESYSDTAGDKAEMLFIAHAVKPLEYGCSFDIGPPPKELEWTGPINFKYYGMRMGRAALDAGPAYIIKVDMENVSALKVKNDQFITAFYPDRVEALYPVTTIISMDDGYRKGDHDFYDVDWLESEDRHGNILTLDRPMTGEFEINMQAITLLMPDGHEPVGDEVGLSWKSTIACYTE